MCQAYTSGYVAAWTWMSKKGHDRCAENGKWSYWCEVCRVQKEDYKMKAPLRVDPDAYGYYELGKAPKDAKIKA